MSETENVEGFRKCELNHRLTDAAHFVRLIHLVVR